MLSLLSKSLNILNFVFYWLKRKLQIMINYHNKLDEDAIETCSNSFW